MYRPTGSISTSAGSASRLPTLVLVLASVAAFVLLLFLGRHATFFNDEWWFISGRQDWNADAFMAPHNGHWALTTAMIWKPLLEVVGLRSYIPYLALAILAHVVLAGGIYRICARQAGPVVALLAAVPFLFFGFASGQGFQGFVFGLIGASAAGVWALALFLEQPSTRRLALVAALLVVAVTTSGAGLFFIAALAAVAIVHAEYRRHIWVIGPVLLIFAPWFVIYGWSSVEGAGGATPLALAQFVFNGLVSTAGFVIGVSSLGGVALAAMTAALGWEVIRNRRLAPGVVAGLGGLLAEFVIVGLARVGQFGPDEAFAPRYAYMGSCFVFIAGTSLLGPYVPRLSVVARAHARAALAALSVVVLFITVIGVRHLVLTVDWWNARADATRAVIAVFVDFGGTPAVPADRRAPPMTDDPWVNAIPPPAQLRDLIARYGSPQTDILAPDQRPIPDDVYRRALEDITIQ